MLRSRLLGRIRLADRFTHIDEAVSIVASRRVGATLEARERRARTRSGTWSSSSEKRGLACARRNAASPPVAPQPCGAYTRNWLPAPRLAVQAGTRSRCGPATSHRNRREADELDPARKHDSLGASRPLGALPRAFESACGGSTRPRGDVLQRSGSTTEVPTTRPFLTAASCKADNPGAAAVPRGATIGERPAAAILCEDHRPGPGSAACADVHGP